eukprot:Sspe_Gene.66944::Locus_39538_Transcript_2_2_Confidence_0.800_Length_509::g.66944::m.66944
MGCWVNSEGRAWDVGMQSTGGGLLWWTWWGGDPRPGRLDKEKEELARHQTNFHKSQEQMAESKEHEHYIQIVENAMWRISILEKRLERHQDQALQKYANLDTKLRNDPRLKELWTEEKREEWCCRNQADG